MKFRMYSLALVTFLALSGLSVLQPRALMGQDFDEGFMFHQPKATVSFNLGYGIPRAGSDLFAEVTDMFTLDKGDFQNVSLGGGVAFFVNERLDVALEFNFGRSSTWSEYVEFVDNDDLPIEQETQLMQVPFTVSGRYFLKERGRAIGNLSWIPTTWAPYIGAGGGKMLYKFEQTGDFVDFEDFSIFRYDYISEGWAWVGHVFGGVQWAISSNFIVSAEGRYSLADAELDRPDFVGYDPIDLAGFGGTIGFGIRF